MPRLRTLLVLGRVSNLPTVWSNCIAGWWLGGGGHERALPFVFAGATLLYLGGMFLNDAFDADFDLQYRKERPIPSGAISSAAVWRWGLVALALGALSLILVNLVTGALGLTLTLSILLYDAFHKRICFAPLLMGLCRFWVYLIGASIGLAGVTGWSIWAGLVLALYIVGLSCLARSESLPGPLRHWPALCLACPIILALLMNANGYRPGALLLSAVLALWVIRCLRPAFWSLAPNISRAVSGLLAGIVFVDWLAVADTPRNFSLLFIGLFLLAQAGQKFVPAT